MKHHVVIVGASYAGLSAMRRLADKPGIGVTLVDRHPYHFLQTEGYDLISGSIPFEETIVSLHALCAYYDNVTFVQSEVRAVENEAKRILLEESEITYDSLVVGLGSVSRKFESDADIENYASGPKSLRGALRLKQFFENELYKRLESDKKAKENFNIVIGGAGLSGVEIAADMQHFFNRYYRSNTLCCACLHIHLIVSRETVLFGMHPAVIATATNRLKRLRVNLHTQCRITAIHEHEVCLSDGAKIGFDFMIFAGGTVVAPVLSSLSLPRNEKGRFLVDAYLRSPSDASVYFAGDVAALHDRKGKALPPTAQTAIQSGDTAALNIMRTVQDEKPKKADLRIDGIAIALGGSYATIDLGWIRINGYAAYLVKKLIERLYKWPLWWRARQGFRKMDHCEI
ncbi:hypothetical protein YH65_06210 [Sulfurovum lithotrophicum]|uniref:FAD/NAD(P)-binding domain-containing protein n=1 Tax=Sulfurovum lithotrophicum TaxID=206403 RepID=A0A7U4M1A1_9BACT|nr:FAD-dependent oxidoreductase [Sulfurovum lithotrophicum]AKF25030.1 hypothetical protein YH65_06210 [Sulfurovum lithotrophicum]